MGYCLLWRGASISGAAFLRRPRKSRFLSALPIPSSYGISMPWLRLFSCNSQYFARRHRSLVALQSSSFSSCISDSSTADCRYAKAEEQVLGASAHFSLQACVHLRTGCIHYVMVAPTKRLRSLVRCPARQRHFQVKHLQALRLWPLTSFAII